MSNDNILNAAFRNAAQNHRQGEVLFVIDRNLGTDTLQQVNDFIAGSGLACKTSAAWFGMYYGLEPLDLTDTAAKSTGHHWNTQDEALPALETLRQNYRDGEYQKPLHVVFIATAHTLGNVDDGNQFSYAQTAKRELKQIAATLKDVTFDAIISTDTTGTQVTARPASVTHPLPLQQAGNANVNFAVALANILAPHMTADAQNNIATGVTQAEKLADGVKQDVRIMKPIRVQKRPPSGSQ